MRLTPIHALLWCVSIVPRSVSDVRSSRLSSSPSIQQLNVSSEERTTKNGRMCLGGSKAKERAWVPDVYGSTIQETHQRCQKDACSLSLSCPHSHPCHLLKALAAFTPTQGVWANAKELYHDVEVLWSYQGPRGNGKMKLGKGNSLPKYMRVALIPRKSAKLRCTGPVYSSMPVHKFFPMRRRDEHTKMELGP